MLSPQKPGAEKPEREPDLADEARLALDRPPSNLLCPEDHFGFSHACAHVKESNRENL
jgi:hypothetical protein